MTSARRVLTAREEAWIHLALSDFIPSTLVRAYGRRDFPDPALRDAAAALHIALRKKPIGRQIDRLVKIVSDLSSLTRLVLVLLWIDRDPEWLRKSSILLSDTSPELLELLGDAVKKRRQRGRAR
jgi:hypothetical protein